MAVAINAVDFDYVRQFLHEHAAITLDNGKEYLVETRLGPLATKEGFGSLDGLVAALRSRAASPALCKKVIDAMTTNETSFYRDIEPFELLRKKIMPELIASRGSERKLRFWFAASSTGQEPYSVAMLLRESFPQLMTWDLQLDASDLSTAVLDKARQARFSQLEVGRGLPAPLLVKYFEKHGFEWQLKDTIRNMVKFQEVNLIRTWPAFPPLDVVFIRNVLIYFDVQTKKTILGRIRRLLKPDGYLFLGGAETTLNLDENFERLPVERAGCYRLTKN